MTFPPLNRAVTLPESLTLKATTAIVKISPNRIWRRALRHTCIKIHVFQGVGLPVRGRFLF